MTVCIAAIGRDGYSHMPDRGDEVIVSVADTKLTLFYTSKDGVVSKRFYFHEEWSAMMAGNDITPCVEIMNASSKLLTKKANTLASVTNAVKTAFQNRLQELIEDKILSRYKMKLADFQHNGKKRFTPEVFNSLCAQIDNTALQCEFLVFGFDKDREPHIFTVTNPGTVGIYDKPGFWAIGSGANTALSMLLYRGQNVDTDMKDTLYHTFEAKFMAESASDVGTETAFFIGKHGHNSMHWSNFRLLEEIREEWEKFGQPQIPPNVLKKIRQAEITLTKETF